MTSFANQITGSIWDGPLSKVFPNRVYAFLFSSVFPLRNLFSKRERVIVAFFYLLCYKSRLVISNMFFLNRGLFV